MYYVVKRSYIVTEQVIVKADTISEAFHKAGDGLGVVIIEYEDDYEPAYDSIAEVAYVSEHTKKQLEQEEN